MPLPHFGYTLYCSICWKEYFITYRKYGKTIASCNCVGGRHISSREPLFDRDVIEKNRKIYLRKLKLERIEQI